MWKAAQQSRAIIYFPQIVSRTEIQYGKTAFDATRFILSPPSNFTGIRNRAKGFNWSVVVTYTLTPGADPANYVPYRKVKNVTEYRDGDQLPPTADEVKLQAFRALLHDDGPCYKNVKRTGSKIIIYDEPGTTQAAEGAVSSWQGRHPIRFCALFQMTLLALSDGIKTTDAKLTMDTVGACTQGNAIPNSAITYGMYMEKEANGKMTGGWSTDWLNFNDYADDIVVCPPPNAGSPGPAPEAQQVKHGGKFAEDPGPVTKAPQVKPGRKYAADV
jgi:hypothetical protein